ncbi:MAG TPA: hypothetical protein ENK84_12515 [Desulfobulbus sp.]|nr:hypothetical protein [Desulfobulbus sp.]
MDIEISGDRSQWHLSVNGVGNNHSLMDITFPEVNIAAPGNDQFLIPKYSGVLLPNPVTNGIDRDLYYPRGWSATMQFLAYYNASYGIYLGFHDPKASLKHFVVKAMDGHLDFRGTWPAADKTVAGNDFHMDGPFELDLFTGDWFDAARIYKSWASQHAEYWPKMAPERKLRQAKLGRIGIWGYYSADTNSSMAAMEGAMSDFIDFFQTDLDVPVGIHWYRWNYKDFDNDYPDYFPERDGMSALIDDIQRSGNAAIMPYINGRLYDTDLTGSWDYTSRGKPSTTKKENGAAYTQNFNNNTFAVMCPTRTDWQDILVDASAQLTGRIGAGGIYIDQVAAAGPTEDMDPAHHHPLGGGHWWRDGYREMFARIRNTIAPGRFIIVEGGADYMADQVDGFLTDGWQADNLVPAFQAVYGGRVQLVGKATGTSRYHNQSFYCKLGQAFVHGVEPGRQALWIVHDTNADQARPFIKKLATMRYKLSDFLAFGTMLRPLPLIGNIPMITSSWRDFGTAVDVTIPAIQTGLYRDEHTGALAAVFVNTSMHDTITFSFNFNGRNYGCSEDLTIRKIQPGTDNPPQTIDNTFSKTVTLAPMDTVAFIVDNCRHPFPWPMILQAITEKYSH